MSRIIAGAAGGLRLHSVPGTGTRPTTDRVKESLFSRLEAWGMLRQARVLDLYAGSGALGCEAASRGADSVDLVERDRKALAVAHANAEVVNRALGETIAVAHRGSVLSFLTAHTGPWDLVLADPPYPLTEEQVTEFLAPLPGRLGPGAVVVVERSARSPEPAWPTGLRRLESSKHGETALWFAEECSARSLES
ncbi:16S rRNA (guanine(966)-N(2))-methyltransferase RsmD [Kocuria sp.]|uniref:16S rRNA (guanine(966)-N(2))-methyltransferase RsmD n=1 Tax=Kocuria sp. TaxID=1871328 RepID=UPI0026E088E5|nr:16S rRNA (guanine(966)-N(2))-methyltransferase RsmD [Kocuria sp.]MDO5618321.1 16S rRNA (guanine(966)-N(2))-methyltransferase RsmD [Kocuria sp.]